MLINIPFGGFYNSLWSDIVDSEIERDCEYRVEQQESEKYHPDEYFPEELRVDYSWQWEYMDYSAAHLAIARDYVDGFARKIDEWAQDMDSAAPPCGITFSRLDSPREYNFRTDDIDCDVSDAFVQWLFAQSEKQGHGELVKTLERRHRSRDGFISHYSWRVADWLEKPVTEWDYHELRSLLESVFPSLASGDEWEWDICYPMAEQDYEYVDSNLDWQKCEERATDERAALLLAWLDDDSDAATAWIANNADKAGRIIAASDDLQAWESGNPVPYRCDKTPDLFANMES